MKMNPITTNVVTAAVTAVVLGLGGWALGVFNAGSDAIDKEQIRTVLREELQTTINGETKTYGEALSAISSNQIMLIATVGEVVNELDDLENAVLALASE